MEINFELNPEKHAIIRVPEGNYFQLCLYDLSSQNLESLQVLSSQKLKNKTANKRGRELAKQLKIPFFSSLRSAANLEQKTALMKINRQKKEQRRREWRERQDNNWQLWRENFATESLAIAKAIQVTNQWIKNLGHIETTYIFDLNGDKTIQYKEYGGMERVWVDRAYEVKDFWIKQNQKYLILGQKVRYEAYKNKWLYFHRFKIEAEIFEFHSYIEPHELSKGMAEDFPPFSGKSLSSSEISEITEICSISRVDRFIEMIFWHLLEKKPW